MDEGQGSLWAIGDIHGCYDQFDHLIEKISKTGFEPERDKLVTLGDYVDRGPDSDLVLERVKLMSDLSKPGHFIPLLGNHEDFMIKGLKGDPLQYDCWLNNGGKQTLKSFGGEERIDPELLEWMEGLKLYHEEPGFFFSHAPIKNTRSKPFSREALIWDHDYYNPPYYHENAVGVCGHQHDMGDGEVRFHYDKYIYVDSGCGCWPSAPLSAVEVRTRKVIQVTPEEVA